MMSENNWNHLQSSVKQSLQPKPDVNILESRRRATEYQSQYSAVIYEYNHHSEFSRYGIELSEIDVTDTDGMGQTTL